MTLRLYWCHTWGCPNYGRPREIAEASLIACPYCGAERKTDSPADHALNMTAPGEEKV